MPTPTLTVPDVSDAFERLARTFSDALRPIAELAAFDAVNVASVVTSTGFDAEVNAGVAFLDERFGRETWLPKIDLDTLNVGYDERCVLAQVTGRDFDEAACQLNGWSFTEFDWEWAYARGFALRENDYESWAAYAAAYDLLTDAWDARVTELRAAATT